MSLNEEVKNILTDTERFLKQQQDLYGDTIFVQNHEPLVADSTQIPASVNTEPAVPEIDLFGNPVKPITGHHKTGELILPAFSNESWTATKDLEELNNAINTCMKCGLGKTRIHIREGLRGPLQGQRRGPGSEE